MRRKHIWNGKTFIDITDMPRRRQIGPNIIRDTQDALQHPIDGKHYDSKSQFRAITAQHGCIEIGNEAQRNTANYEPTDIAADIAQAFQMVEQGYRAPPIEEHIGEGDWANTRIL